MEFLQELLQYPYALATGAFGLISLCISGAVFIIQRQNAKRMRTMEGVWQLK